MILLCSSQMRNQCHPDSSFRIQSEVEQPEVYLLSTGSSSAEDQVALVGDRIGFEDTCENREWDGSYRHCAVFHPAAQLEQGTKQGGYYKCGACGCKETLFSDQAHTLVHAWRPLSQLQSLATGGTFGRQAGTVRPFH